MKIRNAIVFATNRPLVSRELLLPGSYIIGVAAFSSDVKGHLAVVYGMVTPRNNAAANSQALNFLREVEEEASKGLHFPVNLTKAFQQAWDAMDLDPAE